MRARRARWGQASGFAGRQTPADGQIPRGRQVATLARMRTVTATRYVTPLREGGSLPALVEADDDGLYVLKFRGAGQGAQGARRRDRRGRAGARARPAGCRSSCWSSSTPTIGARRARPRDPGPAARERRAQPRRRLPARARCRSARAAGPAPDADVRRRRRLARRARDERRPHRRTTRTCSGWHGAPLADRPRRGAVLPPRARRRSPAHERGALRGDPRPRAAAVRGVDRGGRRAGSRRGRRRAPGARSRRALPASLARERRSAACTSTT